MNAKKYEVIRLTRTKETAHGQREIIVDIRLNDIIKLMHIEPQIITGRVIEIDENYLIVDSSQVYAAQTIKVHYSEMIWVQKIKRGKIQYLQEEHYE